jgi:hypothetical protein
MYYERFLDDSQRLTARLSSLTRGPTSSPRPWDEVANLEAWNWEGSRSHWAPGVVQPVVAVLADPAAADLHQPGPDVFRMRPIVIRGSCSPRVARTLSPARAW